MTRPLSRLRRATALATTAALTASAVVALSSAVASATPQAGDREVQVLSYNIQHGRDLDRVVDIERTAEVVRASGAEIVTLQEVDRHFGERSGFLDQSRELARILGMHVTYGANIEWPPLEDGAPPRQYGTAILSRYPILASENTPLPIHGVPRPPPESPTDEDWSEPRGVLWARVNVRGVPVNVYTTHLQSDRTAPTPESGQQQRGEQVAAILDLIETRGGLTILTGDLNALPDSGQVAPLYGPLRDAWLEAGTGGPGYTAYLPGPDRRIDYVLVSPEIAVTRTQVLDADASDHLPVQADLRLPGSHVGRG